MVFYAQWLMIKNEYQYIRVRYKEGHLSFWKKRDY